MGNIHNNYELLLRFSVIKPYVGQTTNKQRDE